MSRDPEERWRRIEEICHAALEREATERHTFVRAACGDDEALRDEVEALLAHQRSAEAFLAGPVAEVAANVMGGTSETSFVGRQLGVYEILSPLGAGGMGEVYRARDTGLRRDVAALNHPNIVTVHSVETLDGIHVLTMELVEGRTLADVIPKQGLDRFLQFGIPLADAVSAAHEKGVTHRDLKPTNVMVTPEGRVKVRDFGPRETA